MRQCAGRFGTAGEPDGTISARVIVVPGIASDRRLSHGVAACSCPGALTAILRVIKAPTGKNLIMMLLLKRALYGAIETADRA
jgi:hypothetical protein